MMQLCIPKMYTLQQEAPKPVPVLCNKVLTNRPPQYGTEFHGAISRQETDDLLAECSQGSYLIRSSLRGDDCYTLVIKFDSLVKNYKLFYDPLLRHHYVGENTFDTVWDLVADGLIHLYVETRGSDVLQKIASANNYESSPYYQARYYTIQSRAEILRRAAARRDSRILHHHNSPTSRRQSIDSISSSMGGGGGGGGGGMCAPSVPPHGPASRLAAQLGGVAAGSGGSSSDSISSPHIVRRRLSKDEAGGSHNQLISAASDLTLETLSILDNNNRCSSPRGDLNTPSSLTGGSGLHLHKTGTTSGGGGSSIGANSSSSRTDGGQSLAERYNLPTQVDVSQLEKFHNFRVHTFRGPHWCDFCTHFMWGLVAQGVKCQDCGFQAHKKCSDRVPPDCLPDMKRLKRVFGVELTGLVKAENRSVPQVLVKCVSEIERRGGLTVEGLYRVAGFHDHVEDIKMAFDKDCDSVDITPGRYEDINTLTSVVKCFLRQLPIPLITYETYPDFIQIIRDDTICPEKRIQALLDVLFKLPPAHYQTLKYFMAHLNRVSEYQQFNMMTSENLAIVLTPTLLNSPDSDPMAYLAGAQYERSVIESLVTDYHLLFT